MIRNASSTLPLILAAVVAVLAPAMTPAMANSSTVSYQGVLRDATLNPVANGGYPMEFSIYGTDSGGSPLWGPEEYASVAVTSGMFSVYLGSIEPLGSLFADHAMLWLEISADTGAGMEAYAPRVPLASVPYAQLALHAASACQAGNADTLVVMAAAAFATAAHGHSGGDITSGTVPFARLPVGGGSSEVAPGDHTHTLNSLSDVSAAGPAAGQALTWNGSNWQAVGGYAIFRDVKASGTAGGTATANTWQTRDLNDMDTNIPGVSLGGNEFTLPAGRYKITASAPAFRTDGHQLALVNAGTGDIEIIGMSQFDHSSNGYTNNRAFLEGRLNLTAPTTYRLRHFTRSGNSGNGLGRQGETTGPAIQEVYAFVSVEKY